jgi:hypothetical protein
VIAAAVTQMKLELAGQGSIAVKIKHLSELGFINPCANAFRFIDFY